MSEQSNQSLEPSASPAEQSQGDQHVPASLPDLTRLEWLTPKEAAIYVRRSLSAFYMWRLRNDLPAASRYRRKVLDAVIEQENRMREIRRQRRGAALRPVSPRKAAI